MSRLTPFVTAGLSLSEGTTCWDIRCLGRTKRRFAVLKRDVICLFLYAPQWDLKVKCSRTDLDEVDLRACMQNQRGDWGLSRRSMR